MIFSWRLYRIILEAKVLGLTGFSFGIGCCVLAASAVAIATIYATNGSIRIGS